MTINKINVNNYAIKDYHRILVDCWYDILSEKYYIFSFDTETMLRADKSYLNGSGQISPMPDTNICVSEYFEVIPGTVVAILNTYVNAYTIAYYNHSKEFIRLENDIIL